MKLIDLLNEHDDVQNVYANFEVSDALMSKMGGWVLPRVPDAMQRSPSCSAEPGLLGRPAPICRATPQGACCAASGEFAGD